MAHPDMQTHEELWSLRQQSGLNQTAFGKAIGGYAQETISRFEQGHQPIPEGVLMLARLLYGGQGTVPQNKGSS